MTRLIGVQLFCTSQVDPTLLISALSHCSRIEAMKLSHSGMTNAHLCTLLPSLTRLKQLTLVEMDFLASLSFASTVPHLSHTLHEFTLLRCWSLPPIELHHLDALTALRRIASLESFVEPLNAYTRERMTPSSECFDRRSWPHLAEFTFRDEREDAESDDDSDDSESEDDDNDSDDDDDMYDDDDDGVDWPSW